MGKIYLYVKKSPKNLFYLGKTEKNPFIYCGSGLIWKRHLKKNNYKSNDIETYILHETENKDEIIFYGNYFSNLFDIINNNKWANLRIENGDGGDTSNCPNYKKPPLITGDKHWTRKPEAKIMLSERIKGDKNPSKRKDVKEKIRLKATGRMVTEETKRKMSENSKGVKNSFYNKKHKEGTKMVMKEKAKGRYSLMWFIEKYGNDEGNKKYNEQRRKNVEQLIKSRNVPRKTHKCPYCELIGKGGNMKRYHFENCKMKNNFKM